MIRSFGDREAAALFSGEHGHARWRSFERVARRKLLLLDAAATLAELWVPPNNRLEALKRGRVGQHSIRVNDQYRICFVWRDGDAFEVEIVDYHDE